MNRFRLFCAAMVAFAGIGLAAPASAQNITAAKPDSIAQVIRAKGYTVTASKDSSGDPILKAEGNGVKFSVFFYGCTNGANCATISFYAGWSDSRVTPTKINAWNKGQRFGRAYLDDDGDPCIEMDVDLDDGGISRVLFEDNLEFWESVMSNYGQYVYK